MNSTYSLEKISPAHAAHFMEEQNKMLDFVNSRILKTENLSFLIGGEKNIQIMLDNHRNHVAFMGVVLQLKDAELLENTLPWVYRAYRNQGFSFEYFKQELELWKQSVAALLNESFSDDISGVYDQLAAMHDKNIEKSNEISRYDFLKSLKHLQKDFLNILLEGNMRKLLAFSDDYLKGDRSMTDYCSELVTPCLYAIGQLWENGEISVAVEHLASSLVTRILASYNLNQPLPEVTKGKVVISSAANEYHEIGAWMTANLFEMDGWDVIYLGANTPVHDVVKVVDDFSPDILGVSVTMVYNLENIRNLFELFRSDPRYNRLKLFAGGSLFSFYPNIAKVLPADFISTNFKKSLDEANRFWLESR